MTKTDASNTKTKQLPLDLGFRSTMGRTDFLIGDSNMDAVGWIDRWPQWGAPMLCIQGPPASGKSHLCSVWQRQSKAAFINPENLVKLSAQEIFESGTAIAIDGLDPWLGEREAETTLFHLYNMLREEQRTMLITMRMAPSSSDFAIPDLASRFRAAPVVTIQSPDDALLSALLVKQFADRQLKIPAEVLTYIVPRMDRSFAAARELVLLADRMALAEKGKITIPLMRRVLNELQRTSH